MDREKRVKVFAKTEGQYRAPAKSGTKGQIAIPTGEKGLFNLGWEKDCLLYPDSQSGIKNQSFYSFMDVFIDIFIGIFFQDI